MPPFPEHYREVGLGRLEAGRERRRTAGAEVANVQPSASAGQNQSAKQSRPTIAVVVVFSLITHSPSLRLRLADRRTGRRRRADRGRNPATQRQAAECGALHLDIAQWAVDDPARLSGRSSPDSRRDPPGQGTQTPQGSDGPAHPRTATCSAGPGWRCAPGPAEQVAVRGCAGPSEPCGVCVPWPGGSRRRRSGKEPPTGPIGGGSSTAHWAMSR